MGWIFLLLAGVFEIGFTTAMRYLSWSVQVRPLLAFVTCAALSFMCLITAIRTVPLGTAYAVWTGIGAAGTAVLGVLCYGEQATPSRLLFLGLLIGSIVGLKLVSGD